MLWEQTSANELKIPWRSIVLYPSQLGVKQRKPGTKTTTFSRLQNWYNQRKATYQQIHEMQNDYDLILLRYSVHDFFLLNFLRKTNKPVFLVHHTLESKELLLDGMLIGQIRSFLEKVIGSMVNKLAMGQIGVTEEILNSISSKTNENSFRFVYPNGIIYESLPSRPILNEIPSFLFVSSSFQPWHGLDRLIKSMSLNSQKFTIHIVGTLTEQQQKECLKDDRLILHGQLNQFEISKLASTCNVGIASLAMDRAGLTQGSTLKVREYLSMGLPVAADHRDIFPEDWQYFKKISVNPSLLIEELLNFSKKSKNTDKQTVQISAMPFIHKKETLKSLYSSILSWEKLK